MNATAFWRLAWKEYRAIRLFWISLVVLVIVMQWLTVWLSRNEHANPVNLIFEYALIAPVLIAVGGAGSAFATEKEEGTFEFLRCAPVSSKQVFFSKFASVLAATVTAYLVLWPITLWFSGGEMPEASLLRGTLGLWPVAALAAIAWGMLFSLLTARPLLAVAMAMVATAVMAIIVVPLNSDSHRGQFELIDYWRAAPLEAAVAVLLLGIDAYFGSRWLHGGITKIRTKRNGKLREVASTADPNEDRAIAMRLLARRSQLAMLGRLLWQQWRQSWRVILLMCLVALPLLAWVQGSPSDYSSQSKTRGPRPEKLGLLLAAWASFCGAMMFRADQERNSFRFFVEHNVPPRLVWLTRQSIWGLAVTIAVLIVGISMRPDWSVTAAMCMLLAFAAGQWTSMFIRSGILAGFFGLIFAVVLCAWVFFIEVLHVSFLWSVLPIPAVLLWSTWLRAPDWARENTRWSARIRAAASTILPFAALLVAVATFRVLQIPRVSPGFDPAQFAVALKPILAAGLETGELYRKAADAYVADNEPKMTGPMGDVPWQALWYFRNQRPTTNLDSPSPWLADNANTLELTLTASQQPHSLFGDPLTETELPPTLPHAGALPRLVHASARQLEAEGKLDEALDRLLAALVVTGQTSDVTPWPEKMQNVEECFKEFTLWGAQKGQTTERIQSAIKKLQAINTDMLRSEYRLKSMYLVARSSILANEANRFTIADVSPNDQYSRGQIERDILWGRLMPWENHRAVRALNVLTSWALFRLSVLPQRFETQYYKEPVPSPVAPTSDLDLESFGNRPAWIDIPRATQANAEYYENALNSTVPDVRWMGVLGTISAREVIEFEARRRGTLLVLALQAYRLEHGELPKSLSDLVGPQLDRLPLDPYSGEEFRYFPNGVPELQELVKAILEDSPTEFLGSDEHAEEVDQSVIDARHKEYRERMSIFGRPGVWSTGPDLRPETDANGNPIYFRFDSRDGQWKPAGWCWPDGMWFPLPDKLKN
jgi:hypothetical protein